MNRDREGEGEGMRARERQTERERQADRESGTCQPASTYQGSRGAHDRCAAAKVSVAAKSYGWDAQMPAQRLRQLPVCKMVIISFSAALSEDGSQLL